MTIAFNISTQLRSIALASESNLKSWYGANLNRHWTNEKQTICVLYCVRFSHFLASLNCLNVITTDTHTPCISSYIILFNRFLAVDMKQSHSVYRSSSRCASNTVNMNQCFYLGHNSYTHVCVTNYHTFSASLQTIELRAVFCQFRWWIDRQEHIIYWLFFSYMKYCVYTERMNIFEPSISL